MGIKCKHCGGEMEFDHIEDGDNLIYFCDCGNHLTINGHNEYLWEMEVPIQFNNK